MMLIQKLCCTTILLIIAVFLSGDVHASASDTINATTKISVCGDGIAEESEDCDTSDLKNQTCQTQGFSTGTLVCDQACEFDRTGCSGTVTTSPTNQPVTNSPVPTLTTPSIPTNTSNQSNSPAPAFFEQVSQPLVQFITGVTLPTQVLRFDTNGDGILQWNEVQANLTIWHTSWKFSQSQATATPECDINGDESCSLVDFSVLMYYVEQ